MIQFFKNLFAEKEWIGTLVGKWTDSDSICTYHLYIKGNKRYCKRIGYLSNCHSYYEQIIIPWLEGAPDEIVAPYLKRWIRSYWKDCDNLPEKQEEKEKPEFKLYKFEKPPDESA